MPISLRVTSFSPGRTATWEPRRVEDRNAAAAAGPRFICSVVRVRKHTEKFFPTPLRATSVHPHQCTRTSCSKSCTLLFIKHPPLLLRAACEPEGWGKKRDKTPHQATRPKQHSVDMLALHSTQNAPKPLHTALLSLTFPVYQCGFSNRVTSTGRWRQVIEQQTGASLGLGEKGRVRDRRDARSASASNTGMNTQFTVALQRSGTHWQTPRETTRQTGIWPSNQSTRIFNQFNFGRRLFLC